MGCKRYFTLLEVVIGLLIAGALFSALMQLYKNISFSHIEAERVREKVFQRESVQLTLMRVFSGVCPLNEDLNCLCKKDFLAGEAFIFAFDNGVDPEPKFCGKVYGALYVDKQQNLCLFTTFTDAWLEDLEGMSKYLQSKQGRLLKIASGIESVRFAFFEEKIKRWESTVETVPVAVRLFVKECGLKELVEYAYLVKDSLPYVTYEKKVI